MTRLKELERKAIERLKAFEPENEPYYLCYSGGKDSDVIKILAAVAGVRYEAYHNLTTADAPKTVKYVKSQSDVIIIKPKLSMWELIPKKKIPPTRLIRYCCSEFKEKNGTGRVKITGTRWAESVKRAENTDVVKIIGKPKTVMKTANDIGADFRQNNMGGIVMNNDNDASRRMVEMCYRTTSTLINPIVDWQNTEVWEYLKYYGCDANPLYSEGFCRVGCIGCPLGGSKSMKKEFKRYPKYKQLYIHAFDRMLKARKQAGMKNNDWRDGEAVMTWWLGDNPNQLTFYDYLDGNEEE